MKRVEIRSLIKSGVNSLTPVLQYWDGDPKDWNAQRNNKYPGVLGVLESVESKIADNMAPVDSWPIKLVISKLDRMDSAPEDYEAIVDSCDEIAQKLIYFYRTSELPFDIESAKRTKFIKKNADCLTGVELEFIIKAQDGTVLC